MKINILEYFDETVKSYGDRIAVIDDDKEITFSDLNQNAIDLCNELISISNNAVRKPIAVYLPKCTECITADLAIIMSGNAYMNLDVKTPKMRIQAILDLVDPMFVITDDKHRNNLPDKYPDEKVFVLATNDTMPMVRERMNLSDCLIDKDPLCIINTSGSTGTPKGVVLNHRSFIDFLEWSLETMPYRNHEIMGCLSPVIFDIYSYELCLLMARGATMMLIPESLAAFPVRILELMQRNHVSYIFWVPTIMVNIANKGLLDHFALPDLHIVWFAGEVFPTKQCNIWRRALPYAMFVNMYGPIEITLDCTYYIIDRQLSDDEPIPIGRACKNTDILLLNENDELVGTNEEGELCVRGTSLAMGYYNNPEKTSAAFVQNPLNHSYPETIYRTGDIAMRNGAGEILFKGRKDTLIKHSGYRIELAEIEHVIVNTLGLVQNGCAVYDRDKKEIALFYEAEQELSVGEARRRIGTALPKYMIPAVYIRMCELPRNPNGKIDRLRLKEM